MGFGKKELAAGLIERVNISKKDALKCVDDLFGDIANAINEGKEVDIFGFGKFQAVDKVATTARNPRTGEAIDVPAKKVVKFKPSKTFKDSLNKE